MKKLIDFIIKMIKKYKELIVYGIFGVATTVVDYAVYFICEQLFKFSGTVSQTIAVIASVLFAFFVNKAFVFLDKDWSFGAVCKQLFTFCAGRAITMLLQIGTVGLFVDILHFPSFYVKLVVSIAVIIINYIVSKLFVFKKKNKKTYTVIRTDELDFSKANVAKVDVWGWGYTERTPETTARVIIVRGKGIAVRMDCKEKKPKALATGFGGEVWLDSCLEFFFGPERGKPYLNVEMNHNCALMCHLGSNRNDRVLITEYFQPEPVISGETDDGWYVQTMVTRDNLLKVFGIDFDTVTKFVGNFYKCGEGEAIPHFGMWSEIKTEKPDFHQSSYFGDFIVKDEN